MKLFEFQLIEIDVNRTFSKEQTEWKIVSAEDEGEAGVFFTEFVTFTFSTTSSATSSVLYATMGSVCFENILRIQC